MALNVICCGTARCLESGAKRLLSLFGYPVAHENDAERASRAALSIQRALAEVNRKNAAAGKPVLNGERRNKPRTPLARQIKTVRTGVIASIHAGAG
jgi:hypothetical protein